MENPKGNWRQLNSEHMAFVCVVFVPLVALCLWTFVQELRLEFGVSLLGGLLILCPLPLPVVLYFKGQPTLFTVAAAVLIPLEILCCFLSLHTIIGIPMLLVVLLVWANAGVVVFRLSKPHGYQVASWICLALIAALVIPYQCLLGLRLLHLHSEAKQIIHYAYNYKLQYGGFPRDLREYSFRHSRLRSHFVYFGGGQDDKFTYPFQDDPKYDRGDKFSLRYFVGDRSTGYWYSSRTGWFIEDD